MWRRSVAVERHHRRLADAEHVHGQKQRCKAAGSLVSENAARGKVKCGDGPSPDHGGQLQHDRRADQDSEVDPPGAFRLFGAGMRDQRKRRNRQHFVEHEQRQHVAGEGDAERARYGDGEAHVEPGLVLFMVSTHVADRIDRGDDPQKACDAGKQHAERFDGEGIFRGRAAFRLTPRSAARRCDMPAKRLAMATKNDLAVASVTPSRRLALFRASAISGYHDQRA